MTKRPLVEVKQASVVFDGKTVLGPLDFSVYPGERTAVLGPNGSGKSTLVKLLTREVYPYAGSGSVTVDGSDRMGAREARTVFAAVSADLESKLVHDPSVQDLVVSGLFGTLGVLQDRLPTCEQLDMAEAVMVKMGIDHLSNRLVSTLSSGERRRTWIARALISRPLALVLDEPTANLDPESRRILHRHLQSAVDASQAILLVTHHEEDLTEQFDRVVMLRSGMIAFDGTRREAEDQNWLKRMFAAPSPAAGGFLLGDHPTPAEYLAAIGSAPVYDVAEQSPLQHAKLLSDRLGNTVLLKREDLQPTFSFKIRGAYCRMAKLTAEERAKGVITASAGNHAQGVALAGAKLGVNTKIVVPCTTPSVKTDAIRALGAELILFGDSYDEAHAYARSLEQEEGRTFVHPYDDPEVIAGQGTIGLEIHRQHPGPIDAVFVAVGGGGLSAGVALALKQLRPGIKVIGVEPEDADAMHRSVAAGERVTLAKVGLLADGVAVKTVGEETFRLCRMLLDEVIVVPNDAICAAVRDIFETCRAVLEPSGALAYAGMKAYVARTGDKGKTFAALACGANLTFERLQYVAERSLVGERREAVFAAKIPERPGSFRKLCQSIGQRSVTEFNYRMGDPKEAVVFVGVSVRDDAERLRLIDSLNEQGYGAIDLTDDDLAASHLRHMVGGRSPHPKSERLFHFDFPERLGALTDFLDHLGGQWNISLFHYRSHGADRGRVLIGFEVNPSTDAAFADFISRVGYEAVEVTDNPGLAAFLR